MSQDTKPNDPSFEQATRGYAEGQRIAKLSVWTLVGIGVAELIVASLSGSVGLLADGVDSISDSAISMMIWLGLRFSRKKPDSYFHYGYYKVESLAALLASIAMIIVASLILYRGYNALLHPQTIEYPALALITLVIAGSISLSRALQMRRVARKHNLLSLRIDSANSIKDATASFVVLVSLVFVSLGFPWMDGIGAIIISMYIYGVAYVSARESSLILLDSFNSPEILELVRKIVKGIPEVKDVSGIKLRRAGPFITGRAEITLNPQLTVGESDIIAERVSQVLSGSIKSLRDFVVIVEPSSSTNKLKENPSEYGEF